MSGKSSIEWTNATWNPLAGCTRVSAGCDHCYAYSLHDMRHEAWKAGTFPTAPKQYHQPFSEVQLIPERLTDPLHWRKPRLVFVNSMSDLFHADVPAVFIAKVFAVMEASPQHMFQVLTKRPQRMRRLMTSDDFQSDIEAAAEDLGLTWPMCDWPAPNIWLGTSVENQDAAYRIDFLVKTPAVVRFLSCEPLLGPLDLGKWINELQWVISGGESGHGFRPLNPNWVRDIRDQCVAANVAHFFKQHGGHTPKAGGRELDGRAWDEMPNDMRAMREEGGVR